MNPENSQLFKLLKKRVVETFTEEHPTASAIENWKGDQIVAFQEDLFSKVKARVSEKWFYTYFKNDVKKLPRIDMLNLLSAYAGYERWDDFKAKNLDKIKVKVGKKNPKLLVWLLSILVLFGIWYFFFTSENKFHFCLVDEDRNAPISEVVDVKILQKKQSPLYIKTDSLGCFSYATTESIIQFIVQSPYYKTDTIIRRLDGGDNPVVKLKTDNYALMLRYYSEGNKIDWQKRKEQLQQLIAKDAEIYQLYAESMGIELYSKEEFINKLTFPTSSLKNIKVLDKQYRNGKIVKLKFMVQ